MDYISESDIRNIVQKVIQTLPATALQSSAASSPQPIPANAHSNNTVAIGSDHGGYEMKSMLLTFLSEQGFQPIDCGTHSKESVDYPDFAYAVADKVRNGSAWRGIVIDGAGIGSCIAANKVPGVRAAMCVDYATAVNSREHNDANLLTLGAGLLGNNQVTLIVKTWLKTPFGGGRHARRVDKITEIEQKFMRGG
jgi:ribose 5-phosphate isomerase B